MFSSFARSIQSIAKGPRAVLAENIAKVLSEHFVLDPNDIESSLLKDARIVLKNTQLRPKTYRHSNLPNTVVSIRGCVEQVIFSWNWSFGSSSGTSAGGMVQDVVLTIRGIQVQIHLNEWDALEEQEQTLVETIAIQEEDAQATEDVKEKESFLQTYVQQIVDNLTLRLEDFEFALQAGNGPSLVIAGNDLQLGTLAIAEDSHKKLSQKISIRSFGVTIRDGAQSVPLLEPFGYAASVVRFSGERFKGGILSGLEIVGLESNDNDESIRFHVGLVQMQALSSLGVMLVPPAVEKSHQESSHESMSIETNGIDSTSTFRLPFPALTIVLPTVDNIPTRITLPRANLLYRANGQIFEIEGQEGIQGNGTPLIALANGGKWSIDFVRKSIHLDPNGGGCHMCLSNDTVKRISSSLASIASHKSIVDMKEKLEVRADNVTTPNREDASEIWTIATGGLHLKLTGDNQWLETSIPNSRLQFCLETKRLTNATIGGCAVKSSFDDVSGIAIPPLTLDSGTLHLPDSIEATLSSTATGLGMKDFLFSFLEPLKETPTSKTALASDKLLVDLPFALELERLRFLIRDSNTSIILGKIRGKGSSVSCDSALYKTGDMQIETKSIHVDNSTHVTVKVGSISSLVIPGVFSLNEPIVDTSISYTSNGIHVDTNTIHGTVQRPKMNPDKNSTTASKINLPFPIQLDVKLLKLRESGTSILFGVKPISLLATQTGSIITVTSRQDAKIRLQQSRELAMDASLGKFSLQLQDIEGNMKVNQFSLSGASLGPCSAACGTLLITIPALTKENGQKLAFQNGLEMKMDSVQVFDKLRPLLDAILGSQSNDPFETFPFPIEIPDLKISASQPPSLLQVRSILANGTTVNCEQFNASVQNLISFSMKGIGADLTKRSLMVRCIESMRLPGIAVLSKPLIDMDLKLVNETLYVNVPNPVHAQIVPKTKAAVPHGKSNEANIPFHINMNIAKVNLKTLRKEDKGCIQLEAIKLGLSPAMIPSQDLLSGEMKNGAKVSLEVHNVGHDMFQVQKIQTSVILELENFETIHQFQLALHSPRIEAGYSTNDWSSLFQETGSNQNEQSKSMKMPFAKVARTSMFISYQGSVVESNATIAIPEFNGNSTTTTDDLAAHYTANVLKRIPGLLTNVNILGANVVDNSFASVGRLAMGAGSITTAGVGSVVGTAAADGVKAAIAAGKSTRNATTDDSYKFGDVTRGVISGLKHATKKGAQSRGSDGSDYVPGDFTVGAAQSLGEYGGRNSKKLASAGASGAAATVGLAVAGPLGFVVGGYLGGKLVGSDKDEHQQQQQKSFHQQQRHEDRLHATAPNQYKKYHQQTQQHQTMQTTDTMRGVDSRRLQHGHYETNSSQYPHQNNNQYYQPHNQQIQVPQNQNHQSQFVSRGHQQQQETSSYKFGDVTRGILAKGKQSDGRSQDSGYKFGDFTRGLFR